MAKRYRRGPLVLTDIHLQLWPGRVTAIIAANGAGKSTLLRIAAGLCPPTTGAAKVRPRRTRYVPDRFAYRDRIPALAYLAHMGRIQGTTTSAARRRGAELLDRLQLAGRPETPLCELSKGNAQKVAIAQAFLTPADLLVLDEPGTGLDEPAHAALRELVRQNADEGGTVVYSAHSDTDELADDRLLLRDGRLTDAAAAPDRSSTATASVVLHGDAALSVPSVATWRLLRGVLSVGGRPEEPHLVVAADEVDTVLRKALHAGWSVHHVERKPYR